MPCATPKRNPSHCKRKRFKIERCKVRSLRSSNVERVLMGSWLMVSRVLRVEGLRVSGAV